MAKGNTLKQDLSVKGAGKKVNIIAPAAAKKSSAAAAAVKKGTSSGAPRKIRTSIYFKRPKTQILEKNPAFPKNSVKRVSKMTEFRILKAPLATESANKKIESNNTITFMVDMFANKIQIAQAINKMYNVKAKRVNTLVTPRGEKKAFVKLAPEYDAADVANKIDRTEMSNIKQRLEDGLSGAVFSVIQWFNGNDYHKAVNNAAAVVLNNTNQNNNNNNNNKQTVKYIKDASGYLLNHKLNIFLVAFGGGVYYLYNNITNSHHQILKRAAQQRVTIYFTNTQATCDQSTALFLQSLDEKLEAAVGAPSIQDIRQAKDVEQKQRLSEKLKVAIFTKVFSTLYIIPLLMLFIRLQVNLIGRYCYLEQILKQQTDMNPSPETNKDSSATNPLSTTRPISEDTESKFFSISNTILEHRFEEFVQQIENQVSLVLEDYKIDQQISYQALLQVFLKIRSHFESKQALSSLAQENCLTRFLLPKNNNNQNNSDNNNGSDNNGQQQEESISSDRLMLLNEIKNIFESDSFIKVLTESMNQSFLQFTENARTIFEDQQKQARAQQLEQMVVGVDDLITSSSIMPIDIASIIPKLNPMHMIVLVPKLNKQHSQTTTPDHIRSIIERIKNQPLVYQFNLSILTNVSDLNKLEY
ncbi:transmembrane protein [Cavenderia fasciculata]|uniref:Transmembrane protein n=1 Tax=Cavenderia fasciculata TaxID=261658 RepID=F4Q894_CACFS|nr:uncharacterized protein DFA_09666 [Cavenderia fasciculata]EGG15994.1 transmembrane protein [Cavenderia fasciculata]|eukprot:XP_004352319.1 transmembrane protein [Cavenderia fasciculata]